VQAAVPERSSLYERLGPTFFVDLVAAFYEGVAADPVLRPMYPTDLAESKRHLAEFLQQYWGGPPRYSVERGHPRLRMRHAPFAVDAAARDAWLGHMRAAVEASAADAADRATLMEYFTMAAEHLVNRPS
jgi:hemoglobin